VCQDKNRNKTCGLTPTHEEKLVLNIPVDTHGLTPVALQFKYLF